MTTKHVLTHEVTQQPTWSVAIETILKILQQNPLMLKYVLKGHNNTPALATQQTSGPITQNPFGLAIRNTSSPTTQSPKTMKRKKKANKMKLH